MKRMKHNIFGISILAVLLGALPVEASRATLDVSVARPVLAADTVQTTYLKVALTGAKITKGNHPAANIAIVLDRSGSMQGEKLLRAKQAAIMAIERLGSSDIVSVIAYDDQIRVLVPATRVSDREAIAGAIEALEAGGSTALFAGVGKGASEVRKFLSRERVNRVILLSDGLANVGPDTPAELGALGASLAKEGVSVTTIGLGLGYNEDLMTKLASRSDGNHAFVEHPRDLARIFEYELGDVQSVVAQDIVITIHCPQGVRPVRVLGRDSEIVGNRIVLHLNQLYAEHEKYALVEVEVTPSRAGEHRGIADVEAVYANMATSQKDRLIASASASFSLNTEEVKGSENAEVMIAVVEQIATEKSQLALVLRDEGKVDEARQMLQLNQAYVQTNADQYQSELLQELAVSNEEDSQKLEEKDWSATRKKMRETQTKSKGQRRW